jgi:hypothetical protein
LRTCLTIEDGPAAGECGAAPGGRRRREERLRSFIAVIGAHPRELLREHPEQRRKA